MQASQKELLWFLCCFGFQNYRIIRIWQNVTEHYRLLWHTVTTVNLMQPTARKLDPELFLDQGMVKAGLGRFTWNWNCSFRSHKILGWICMNLPHRWKTSRLCALWSQFAFGSQAYQQALKAAERQASLQHACQFYPLFIWWESKFEWHIGCFKFSHRYGFLGSQAEPSWATFSLESSWIFSLLHPENSWDLFNSQISSHYVWYQMVPWMKQKGTLSGPHFSTFLGMQCFCYIMFDHLCSYTFNIPLIR